MIDGATGDAARREGLAAARRFRLPFGRQRWRGHAGGWAGAGAGSSIDFQDHRAYMPGDDPRHIHWAAYARSGQLTMKLYRAEVSPSVDLAVDVSASMRFLPEKENRLFELMAFCVESADQAGAPLRIHAINARECRPVPAEQVRAARWNELLGEAAQGATARPPGGIPWRASAMKVLITDLLYAGEPSRVLGELTAGGGAALVLVPAAAAEAEAPGRGNVELVDCESGAVRRQRIDTSLAGRYRLAYERHFALWEDAARRLGVGLARIACEGPLSQALGGEALSRGLVEMET